MQNICITSLVVSYDTGHLKETKGEISLFLSVLEASFSPERVIHQLPVSRGTWETEQKSGHTEIFIVFAWL